MRMGQGVRTGLGHGGITCVLQTQLFRFFFSRVYIYTENLIGKLLQLFSANEFVSADVS